MGSGLDSPGGPPDEPQSGEYIRQHGDDDENCDARFHVSSSKGNRAMWSKSSFRRLLHAQTTSPMNSSSRDSVIIPRTTPIIAPPRRCTSASADRTPAHPI